jgi:hypothetical protein
MNPPPTPHHEQYPASQFWEHYPSGAEVHGGRFQDMIHPRTLGNLPKIQFPSFDGENPRLWQKRCEDYFHMYSVDPSLWIQVAYMQFTGSAARWVQSVESQLVSLTWDQFAHMVRERFGKNHHQMLLRQLFHIRQTASVASYVEEFHQLVDQLNAYQTMPDPLYYTMKFVDGLRDDIKVVVMLQRPPDVDTVAVLAQLQEEAGALVKKRESRWPDSKNYTKNFGASVLTARDIKSNSIAGEDKTATGTSSDDRLTSLYAYRKAKGLCFKCGAPFARGHKCADSVQLHLVEEMWKMVQLPEEELVEDTADGETELNVLHLSRAAVTGLEVPRMMKFVGHISGLDVLVLLDSGSSHSFISTTVAQSLPNVTTISKPFQVQVANGSQLQCTQQVIGAC